MQIENLGARFQPRLFSAIPAAIIEVIDGERRVADIKLRKILGHKSLVSFRASFSYYLLWKLEKFGLVVRRGAGGDDYPLYWFNEAQTTYLIFKSGLPAPNELIDDIIRTCPTFAAPAACDRQTNPAGHWALRRTDLPALDAEEPVARRPYAPRITLSALRFADTRPAHDAAELARSLLAELAPAERAELLTNQLIKVRDLRVLTRARNLLTSEIEELILEKYGVEA